jgi:hypothetical protein
MTKRKIKDKFNNLKVTLDILRLADYLGFDVRDLINWIKEILNFFI